MSYLHHDAGARELGVLRVAVFGVWLVLIWQLPVSNLALLPRELIDPPGLAGLLPLEAVFSSATAMGWLKAATLVGCAACIAGARPFRPIALATWILIWLVDASMKSIGGFVNHAQLGPLYVAFIVALSPAAEGLRMRLSRRPDSLDAVMGTGSAWRFVVPLQASALVLATAYAFMGIRRLVRGGVGIYLDGSLDLWLVARSLQHSAYPFDLGLLALRSATFSMVVALGFAVATLFEATSPLALRFAAYRFAWLLIIGGLHVMTLLTMNIFFWENLVLILVLFTGLPTLIARRAPLATSDDRERSRVVE